jgi:hypothetical protein
MSDTEKILEELRLIRKLVVHVAADVASMKPFVAAAGKAAGMTLEQAVEQMNETATNIRNQLSQADVDKRQAPTSEDQHAEPSTGGAR